MDSAPVAPPMAPIAPLDESKFASFQKFMQQTVAQPAQLSCDLCQQQASNLAPSLVSPSLQICDNCWELEKAKGIMDSMRQRAPPSYQALYCESMCQWCGKHAAKYTSSVVASQKLCKSCAT